MADTELFTRNELRRSKRGILMIDTVVNKVQEK